jgi:hypothetical protein
MDPGHSYADLRYRSTTRALSSTAMRASSSRMISTVACIVVSCYLSLRSGSRYIVCRTMVGPGSLRGRLLCCCRYAPMRQPVTNIAPIDAIRIMIVSMSHLLLWLTHWWQWLAINGDLIGLRISCSWYRHVVPVFRTLVTVACTRRMHATAANCEKQKHKEQNKR